MRSSCWRRFCRKCAGAEPTWRGLAGAVEMCNNNGHCRKFDAGTMCPSFRVTRDEQHTTRGRANTLRLALSGQLGPEAAEFMKDTPMYELYHRVAPRPPGTSSEGRPGTRKGRFGKQQRTRFGGRRG